MHVRTCEIQTELVVANLVTLLIKVNLMLITNILEKKKSEGFRKPAKIIKKIQK